MSWHQKIRFENLGRLYQLRIRTAEDLRFAAEMDETLWVATSTPINTLIGDATFLSLLDSDGDGRIRHLDVREAILWMLAHLRETSGVEAASDVLKLEAINTETPEGRRIHESVVKMLARLGAPQADRITLEQIRQIKAQVEGTAVSEAGVALPDAAEDEATRQFLSDILATVGGAPHPSGSAGVTEEKLTEFLDAAKAYLQWAEKGKIPEGQQASEIMPLGRETPSAFEALARVREKLEQYFAQVKLAAYDARLAEGVTSIQTQGGETDFSEPACIEALLARAPLARPGADGTLKFDEVLNPLFKEPIEQFRRKVAEPILGRQISSMSVEDFAAIKQAFLPYETWSAANPAQAVEPLGSEKLRRYLQGDLVEKVRGLIAHSATTAFVLDNIRAAEKLALFQAHLLALANNFVSFPHLYDPHTRAMFDCGTLIMDGRRFNLSVRADDRAAHGAIAKAGNTFVLYVEISPPGGEPPYHLAVPVTHGGRGNLAVLKRGIFQDVHGRECDAKVVQIIENPISLGEAILAPFQRLGRLLSGKIEAITTQAEKKLDQSASAAVTQATTSSAQPTAEQAQRNRGMLAGGLLMGGGVAIAALGSAIAYITKTIADIGKITLLIGLLAAVLAVIVPTSLVAFLKLRRRDLSAILEGSGWAINARMRLTRRQRRYFTQRPGLPHGAKKIRRYGWYLAAGALVILLALGVGAYLRRCSAKRRAPATQPAAALERPRRGHPGEASPGKPTATALSSAWPIGYTERLAFITGGSPWFVETSKHCCWG